MIDKILSGIGNSNTGKKFFKWAAKPASERFLNNTLPQIETVFSTACYMVSTARQKNIDDDRKKMLQIQHLASGVIGLTVASAANKAISNFGEKVVEHLDPQKINPEAVKQVSTGLKVALPLVTTSCIMRFAIPSAIPYYILLHYEKLRSGSPL